MDNKKKENRTQHTPKIAWIIQGTLVVLMGIQGYRHIKDVNILHFIIILGMALGTADILSGIVHWGADTWGKVEWPIIGHVIEAFRDHHINQSMMAKQSFFKNNGDNMGIAIGMQVGSLLCQWVYQGQSTLYHGMHLYIAILAALIAVTNQIHAYCHTPVSALPPSIRWLQQHGIILSHEAHMKHHSPPHDRHYCITTGWCNSFLDDIQFWRRSETLVKYLTGAIPREEDLQWRHYSVGK